MNKKDIPHPTSIIKQAAREIDKTRKNINKDKKLFEEEWQRWGVKKKK